MLVPGAAVVVGVAMAIAGAFMSTLTTEGVAAGLAWKARAALLRREVNEKRHGSEQDCRTWLPAAVGAGVGRKWARACGDDLSDAALGAFSAPENVPATPT